MIKKNLKIILVLGSAFFITLFLSNTVFLFNSPRFRKPTPIPIPTILLPTTRPTVVSRDPVLPTSSRNVGTTPTPKKTTPTTKPKVQPTSSPTVVNKPINPPIPTKAPGINCPQNSSNNYGSIDVANDGDNRPAESHPDKNIHVRGYSATTGTYSLIHIDGGVDEKGPNLSTVVEKNPPTITGLYRVNTWDWNSDQKGPPDTTWPVSILGVLAQPGQPVYVADSGYDVSLGYDAIVLYADESTVTLKYTREDSVRWGYTVHIEDICVDPNLIRSYQSLNTQGRAVLPAVRGGDEIGVARTNEVKMAIRDTGQFLDPRSDKDWWR